MGICIMQIDTMFMDQMLKSKGKKSNNKCIAIGIFFPSICSKCESVLNSENHLCYYDES